MTASPIDPRREDNTPRASERSFGFVFAALFAIIGLFPLLHGNPARMWSLAVGGIFLLVALQCPRLLRGMNGVWHKFGLLLHHIVTPLMMGIIFFGVVTPVALLAKLTGKRFLPLKRDPAANTYWVARTGAPTSMEQQF